MKPNFTRIMVEKDGQEIDIQNLQKEDYEYFLELMEHLRLAYVAATSGRP